MRSRKPISICFILCVSVAAVAMPHPASAEGPEFVVDASWPKPLPNNWILGQVAGIAVDDQDHVWVLHRPRTLTEDERGATLTPPRSKCCIPAPPVIEFDREGNVVNSWGGPGTGYEWPSNEHGLQIDHNGNVWLGGNGAGTADDEGRTGEDTSDGMVLKFTRDGAFLLQIGRAGSLQGSTVTDQLGRAANLAFDAAANEVYIADGYANHRIIVFDADSGAFKRMWGAYGNVPSDEELPLYTLDSPQFANPVHCVRVSNDGLIYVCDRSNNRVQIFTTDGTFVRQFVFEPDTRGSGSVWDMDLWPDDNQTYLIIVDGTNNEMRVVRRADGVVLNIFGRSGRNAGQFHWVHNIAIDSEGNVFTTEVDNGKRVQKWMLTNR